MQVPKNCYWNIVLNMLFFTFHHQSHMNVCGVCTGMNVGVAYSSSYGIVHTQDVTVGSIIEQTGVCSILWMIHI